MVLFKDQTATLLACRLGCLKMGDPGIPQNPVVYQHFLHPKCHASGYLTVQKRHEAEAEEQAKKEKMTQILQEVTWAAHPAMDFPCSG